MKHRAGGGRGEGGNTSGGGQQGGPARAGGGGTGGEGPGGAGQGRGAPASNQTKIQFILKFIFIIEHIKKTIIFFKIKKKINK